AGLGATGGGVPGDVYPNVSTGVLAQIQHLVVYSGEQVARPVGHRTRLKQGDILRASARVAARRAVTFQDLAGRWAADRAYGRTINAIARRFYTSHCQEAGSSIVRPAHAASNGAPPLPTRQRTASPVVVQTVPRPVLLRRSPQAQAALPRPVAPTPQRSIHAAAGNEAASIAPLPTDVGSTLVTPAGGSTEENGRARDLAASANGPVSPFAGAAATFPAPPAIAPAGRWAAPALGTSGIGPEGN
ncbi:MAG: hypothetical protein RLZ98_3499, partial [Pseudomonadota bacterium]